ncbi:MAG: 2-oxoacid:acceptor oxidoreductase family protein [Haliea sp.]|nr:2-oxoacid:acceptor oxidoreductase family protein [Haliea sp.]
MAGIGGTGVLTIGALLGMAAHLEGKGSSILDMTGMAQKGGSVTSHIRIGNDPAQIFTARLSEGMTDLLVACDMIVGSGPAVLKTVRPAHTAAILNTDVAPTGQFQSNKAIDLGEARLRQAIIAAMDGGEVFELPASRLATELTGDSIATNILMLGYAAQKGLLPLSIASIEEAIRLNGTFVQGNLRTFNLGRLAAHDAGALDTALGGDTTPVRLDTTDEVLASRTQLLTDYQNAAYAERYSAFVQEIRRRVSVRALPGGEAFVRAVALTLGRLMAYKDEYEVARLYADDKFLQRIKQQFAGDFTMNFHLAPPMLPGRDASGRPKKRQFGPWVMSVYKLLRRMKGLRGTPFDPFGYFPERRLERRLIQEYRALIESLVDRLDLDNLAAAIELARAASDIAGYGPVKAASVERYLARLPVLLQDFEQPRAERILAVG